MGVPIPSVVIVVAGKIAGVPNWTIFLVVCGSRFVQLCISGCLMRMQFKGTGPFAEEGDNSEPKESVTVESFLTEKFKEFGVDVEEVGLGSSGAGAGRKSRLLVLGKSSKARVVVGRKAVARRMIEFFI